jgi:predicted metal-binding protein
MTNIEKRIIPRKVLEPVPDVILQKDLEKYRLKALELGAAGARIIKSEIVPIQYRVVAKCTYPKCSFYGTCANCPPYAMSVDQIRKTIAEYRYAVFLWIELPRESFIGRTIDEAIRPMQRKMHELVSKIESAAFYDGYVLALGFSGGSCKNAFCPDLECNALKPGQSCRFPFKARSSMEAVGINVMALATRLGLDMYPLGFSVLPEDVPSGRRCGIVFID